MAHVTASRIAARPKRRLRIWASEGYAGVDFVSRKLSLVQPSDDVKRHGLNVTRLDPAAKARLKDEVFGRHLEVLNASTATASTTSSRPSLRHFLDCVRHRRTPRVTGEDGRDALALAHRVLDAVKAHQWEGRPDGAVGPNRMPRPLGKLFTSGGDQSAVA